MSGNINRNSNKGSSRKSRLNKTGTSEFIGFSAFSKKSTNSAASSAKSSKASDAASLSSSQSSSRKVKDNSSRFFPSPVFIPTSAGANNTSELLSTLFKKIGRKRDSTTRSKALADLCSLAFADTKKQEVSLTKPQIIAALSHLTFLFYTKLAHDNDRTVRAQALNCLAQAQNVVPKAWHALMLCPTSSTNYIQHKTPTLSTSENEEGSSSKNIQIISPSVLGIIWCLQSDPAVEVQRQAKLCMEFINTKKRETFETADQSIETGIVAHILSTLKHSRASSLAEVHSASRMKNQSLSQTDSVKDKTSFKKKKNDPNKQVITTTEDDHKEDEERFDRIITSTLQALQLYIFHLNQNHSSKSNHASSDITPLSILLANGKIIWKHTLSSKPSFRRESYRLISTLAQSQVPNGKDTNHVAISTNILHQTFAPETYLYSSLSTEKDPSNHPILMEATLLYLSSFSSFANDRNEASGNTNLFRWDVVDCNILCKHISKLFRKSCYGSSATIWAPYVLPFIHLLPLPYVSSNDRIEDEDKSNENWLALPCQMIASLWEGREHATLRKNDQTAIVLAVAECSSYLLLRKTKISHDQNSNESLSVNDHLTKYIQQLCSFFNSSLSYFFELSTTTKSNSIRPVRKNSKEYELLQTLARDIYKFDSICHSERKHDSNTTSLIYSAKPYLWGSSTKNETNKDNGMLYETLTSENLDETTANAMKILLQEITKEAKNENKDENESKETRDGIYPLRTSLLIPTSQVLANTVISRCRNNTSNKEEIELLQYIIESFGVKQILSTKLLVTEVMGEELKPEKPPTESQVIEYFSMNDLLKLIIVHGHTDGNDDSNSIIRSCFNLLRYCLREISSPLHQKKLWEAFFKELVTVSCSLKTLAIGFNVLTDNLQQNDEEILTILRCRAVEDFAIDVGIDTSFSFKYGYKNGDELICEEKEDVIITKVDGTNHSNVSYFLRTCVGLTGNHLSIVGPKVISKWIELACSKVEGKEYVKGQEETLEEITHHENDSNILLETLLELAVTSLNNPETNPTSIGKEELVGLLVETWHQITRTWNKEVSNIFNLIRKKDTSLASYIQEKVIFIAVGVLTDELAHPTHQQKSDFDSDLIQDNSLKWATRAWRILLLQNDFKDVRSSFSHLNTVGLNNLELWDSKVKDMSEWMFWCLFYLLLHFQEGVDQTATFLSDCRQDAGKLLYHILRSISFQSESSFVKPILSQRDSSMYQCKLVLDTIFYKNTTDNESYDELIGICCTEAIQSLSISLDKIIIKNSTGEKNGEWNQMLTCDSRVLDIFTSNLLEEIVIEEKNDLLNNIIASEIKVGDKLWYEQKLDTGEKSINNSQLYERVQAEILKIHTDDFPNLYFTVKIYGNNGVSERQTIASRLKKHRRNLSSTKIMDKRASDKQLLAKRLEQLMFDKILKKVFLPAMSQNCEVSTLETIAKLVNIVIYRCGLTGGMGLGTLRYEIFQIISNLDRQVADKLSASEVNELPIQSLRCLCFAMMGNPSIPSTNFGILRYNSIYSLEAICNWYESEDLFQSISNSSKLMFHSSVLMWISICSFTANDFRMLCRISNVLEKTATIVLQNVTIENEDTLHDSFFIMKALLTLQNAHLSMPQKDETMFNSSNFLCIQELIRCFTFVWKDVEEENSLSRYDFSVEDRTTKPLWFDQFSTLLLSSHFEIKVYLKSGAKLFVNELCQLLFSPCKRICALLLLRMVSTSCSQSDNDLSLSTKSLLEITSENMTEDEKNELEDDFNITSKWLPQGLMVEIESWEAEETSNIESKELIIGRLLTWLVMLDFLERAGNIDARNRTAISSYIQVTKAVNVILETALKVATLKEKPDEESLFKKSPKSLDNMPVDDLMTKVANVVIFRSVQILPTITKLWWNDYCPRAEQAPVNEFVQTHVAPEILRKELLRINTATNLGEMVVNGSCVSREVTAMYEQDECQLSVMIRIPPSFPLRNVEVDCQKTRGIAEKRWRRWSLQIMRMLNSQDGTILDALMLWKENVDKEFEGVEPCPVCYSVLDVKTHCMPNLECNTCHNRFHSTCLYKWFQSSGKSQCVLCQQPWSGTKV